MLPFILSFFFEGESDEEGVESNEDEGKRDEEGVESNEDEGESDEEGYLERNEDEACRIRHYVETIGNN